MSRNLFKMLYYVIVIGCVTISIFLSYREFLTSLQEFALPFSLILGLSLFGADVLVQRSKSEGIGLMRPLALWAFVAFFSSASNFNYVYTNFMEKDVTEQTLDAQYFVFRDDLTATRQALTELDAFEFTEQKRVELDRKLARLRTQFTDPNRPGCGERCREHLGTIEQILGEPLTELKIPDNRAQIDVLNTWYEKIRETALADFEKLVQVNEFPQISGLIRAIDRLLIEYDTPDRALARNGGLSELRRLAEHSEEVERRANALLPAKSQVNHNSIDTTLGRLGEIAYSFQNGFSEMPNPFATFISLLISIAVDLIPILFALIAFSPETIRPAAPRSRRGGMQLLDR